MEEIKRNYKAEWQKEKETKTSRLLKIDKKLNEILSKKLKEDNMTYSQFIHICINKYINGDLKFEMKNHEKNKKIDEKLNSNPKD